MSSSAIEFRDVTARSVAVTEDELTVELTDGRAITVPLTWYPRLLHGTADERSNWRLIGAGEGINWPALDEDISIAGLLAGRPSAEAPASLERWLKQRPLSNHGLQGTGGQSSEHSTGGGEAAGP